jgi:hypothetical protein
MKMRCGGTSAARAGRENPVALCPGIYASCSLFPHAKAVTPAGAFTSRRSWGSETGDRRGRSRDLRNHSRDLRNHSRIPVQGHTRIPAGGHTRIRNRDLGDRIPCRTLGADQAL